MFTNKILNYHLYRLINSKIVKLFKNNVKWFSIENVLSIIKDKIAIIKQINVIYQINCSNCNQNNIGNTSTNIETRIYNHKNNVKTLTKTNTAL